MNTQDLIRLGVPPGEATRRGMDFISRYILKGLDRSLLAADLADVVKNPETYVNDPLRGEFAKTLLRVGRPIRAAVAPWRQWGEGLDPEAMNQMGRACQLPISVAGALMPDAHVGYGLPIGGVLATDNAVIPYAVGVDIACRMKLTVLDLPVRDLDRKREGLTHAIESETRFGIGASFQDRRDHAVMEGDWTVSPVTRQHRDRAWAQLGTSGSGNHFVEFGVFSAGGRIGSLEPGEYVALLSHSGSRGTGAAVCDFYSRRAMELHPELPREHRHLAWLGLDSPEGVEYWAAMELMGRYAAANHELIHQHIARRLGLEVLLDVENHHNFAWKERHRIGGIERDLVVHRKGATPAGEGVLGIIPGSMATPGFLVRGRGESASLRSASHGAGRVMSRTRAMETFEWEKVNRLLKDRGVRLLSAGLDEVPMVYKDIHQVMAAQQDLVEVLGRFDPRLVKMAPHGERPED
ncbi:MAG TPA: RNA-splicing ligase RtcB [Verrucomicrobiales bacterium]|nr:RNA-splicing ligase RtcB [Verrucomicrobiales bacterium]